MFCADDEEDGDPEPPPPPLISQRRDKKENTTVKAPKLLSFADEGNLLDRVKVKRLVSRHFVGQFFCGSIQLFKARSAKVFETFEYIYDLSITGYLHILS